MNDGQVLGYFLQKKASVFLQTKSFRPLKGGTYHIWSLVLDAGTGHWFAFHHDFRKTSGRNRKDFRTCLAQPDASSSVFLGS